MRFRFLLLTLGLFMAFASVSVFAENAPVDNAEIASLVPAVPGNGSGADYLGYIHASQVAKGKVIETLKAKAQEKGQEFTIANIRAVESAFIQKDIEAATKGMEVLHCPESVYANLAVFKAQFLFVKWQLMKDPSGETELKEFIDKLREDGKDATLKHVLGKINGLRSQIFRSRLGACVKSQNAEEMGRLVDEMNATLAQANNGKDVTPEMAQDAIALMFLVQKVPAYKPTENLIQKYLDMLSNATNPQAKKIVDDLKNKIVQAIKAAQQKKQEEERQKQEEQEKQKEQESDQNPLPNRLMI